MTMIASMGLRYCSEYLTNALMVYEGRPAQLMEVMDDYCGIRFLDGRSPSSARAPHSYFTGWRVFAYPELGYRRVGNVVYHVHRQQTAYRGLRANILSFENSPLSALLTHSERFEGRVLPNTSQRLSAVLTPTYDTSTQLDELIAGTLSGVVPNQHICIEPSLTDDTYIILYRTKIIGHMDRSKNFHINNPALLAEVRAAFTE